MAGLKIAKGSYLKPSDLASVTWLGLFLPGLVCYVYFLSQHLNQYDEVPNSFVERFSSRLDEVVPPGAKVEMVANGFGHTEGPQWVNDEEAGRQYLLFSDIPNNRIWKWEEGGGIFTLGKSLFLDRSGCRGDHCAGIPRLGSNGLVIAPGTGEVVMCEHGDRRVTRMENNGTKTALATHYNGRRLNSPNDLVFSRRGDLYFTDPPYGLPLGPEDPAFAANGFGGVYRIRRETINAATSGQLVAAEPELLERDLMFPNGLAFSADFSKLYLSVSSPEEPAWYVYDLDDEGRLTNRRRLLDAKPMQKGGRTGCPDGVKVDAEGVIFAASPGGVAVINSDGDHLGTVFTGGVVVANVALGGDGYLYIAAADSIMRIRVMTKASPTPIPP